ncbi:MAG TPA: Tad domain-containing protein, partial [Anaerolineales bacterium]|nr:Tad domain-containing protein [Anaerolineales bacterium]
MFFKASEKGQALILIVLAAIGLFAFAALAIDGSRVYSTKRHAQNAADTAVMAAALAYTRNNSISLADLEQKAEDRATDNGYDNGDTNDVTVTVVDITPASGLCPGDTAGKDITVDIVSYVDTTFARVIGRDEVTTAVTATSRACGYYRASLFDGNAIVGLNPNKSTPCGFTTGSTSSARWKIKGSGLYSNGCAYSKIAESVDFVDPGTCASVPLGGEANGTWECTPKTGKAIDYPADVLKIMPENPCDGDGEGDIGLPPPSSGSTFENGVYCISDMDAYDQMDIHLENATLYVTDAEFELKFAGGGGFSGTPTSSGEFEDYYMVIAYKPPPAVPCPDFNDKNSQVIQYRGNGSGTFSGTILAPSACIDLRGNGLANAIHTQVIAYNVSTNGTADVYIQYVPDENHKEPVYPT